MRPTVIITSLAVCVAACALRLETPPRLAAAEKTQDEEIRRLIRELDHDKFARREIASGKLLQIGDAALPLLRRAAKDGSPEVRSRARRIVAIVFNADMTKRLTELVRKKKDTEIDVDAGMWLIARILDPEVKKQSLDRQLDALAARVRKKFGRDVNPAAVAPEKAVAAIRQVLFTELGFTGNQQDYNNPVNSSLHHVLKTRKGLPILLSHVVVSVAQRLEIPIVGLGIPGRYMCKYDGSQAPGKPTEDIIIDPFGAGRVVTVNQLKKEIPSFNPATHLKPSGHRSTLVRMLTNLANEYQQAGKQGMAQRVYEYQQILKEPETAP